MSWQYEDILNLPHPVQSRRVPMSMVDRAAQFAPFAALTGHDGVIRETARVTEPPVELTESRREELDEWLRRLSDKVEEKPKVAITCFVPDGRKAGGAYVRTVGRVKRVDGFARRVILVDGSEIPMDAITEVTTVE